MSMVWIASATLNSNGSFNFTSIPQTFTHLQVRFTGNIYVSTGSGISAVYVTANSDNVNAGGGHQLYGNGSSVISSYDSLSSLIFSCYGFTNTVSAAVWDILDYSNTNKYKTYRAISGYDANGSGYVALNSALYKSTSAITSIQLVGGGNSIAAGSRVDLYGITTSSVTGA